MRPDSPAPGNHIRKFLAKFGAVDGDFRSSLFVKLVARRAHTVAVANAVFIFDCDNDPHRGAVSVSNVAFNHGASLAGFFGLSMLFVNHHWNPLIPAFPAVPAFIIIFDCVACVLPSRGHGAGMHPKIAGGANRRGNVCFHCAQADNNIFRQRLAS